MGSAPAQIPTSFGHELRACLRCRLVKTYDQFRESGCENCPFFKMEDDHERVADCTTPNFNGIISVMDPSRSWAARWLRIAKFVPGVYTLAVSEALPEEMQEGRWGKSLSSFLIVVQTMEVEYLQGLSIFKQTRWKLVGDYLCPKLIGLHLTQLLHSQLQAH